MSLLSRHLPVELAGQIYEFASTTRPSYRALSLVSRQTRAIVLIYAIPSVTVELDGAKSVMSFRELLASHPEVAPRIQNLRVMFYFSGSSGGGVNVNGALQTILKSCINIVELVTSTRILEHTLNKLPDFPLRKVTTLNLKCDDFDSTRAVNQHPNSQALLSQITHLVTSFEYRNMQLFEVLVPYEGAPWNFTNLTHFASAAKSLPHDCPRLRFLHDEGMFPALENVVFDINSAFQELLVWPHLLGPHAARHHLLTKAKEWDKLYLLFHHKLPVVDRWLEAGDLIWEEGQRVVHHHPIEKEDAVFEFSESPHLDAFMDDVTKVEM